MGRIHSGDGWIIKVHGDEHPPVHAHVLHAAGKASIALNGTTINAGVPPTVIVCARAWIVAHPEIVEAEWQRMNNPRRR